MNKQIIFVDSSVQDYQSLIQGIDPAQIVILNENSSAIDQITNSLAHQKDIEAVHIVSHGSEGSLKLGADVLNDNNLETFSNQVKQWGNALTANGQILLYGCNVAAGEVGENFVKRLSGITGAEVAASTDKTGNAALGGDWELEKSTGQITASLAFDDTTLNNYVGIFPLPGARSIATTGSVYLGGNFVELGIDVNGTFGGDATPPGFFGRQPGIGPGIGMVSDTDGFDTGKDLRIDYFLPGTPEERFVAGYKIGGIAVTGAASQNGPTTTFTGTTITNTSIGSTLSGQVVTDLGGNLRITQNISFEVNDRSFKNTVTLTNIGRSEER